MSVYVCECGCECSATIEQHVFRIWDSTRINRTELKMTWLVVVCVIFGERTEQHTQTLECATTRDVIRYYAAWVVRIWFCVAYTRMHWRPLGFTYSNCNRVTAKLCKNMRELVMRPSSLAEQVRHRTSPWCAVPKAKCQQLVQRKWIMCAAIDILAACSFERIARSLPTCTRTYEMHSTKHRQLCVAIDLGRIVSFAHLELPMCACAGGSCALVCMRVLNANGRESDKFFHKCVCLIMP